MLRFSFNTLLRWFSLVYSTPALLAFQFCSQPVESLHLRVRISKMLKRGQIVAVGLVGGGGGGCELTVFISQTYWDGHLLKSFWQAKIVLKMSGSRTTYGHQGDGCWTRQPWTLILWRLYASLHCITWLLLLFFPGRSAFTAECTFYWRVFSFYKHTVTKWSLYKSI